MTGLQFGVDFSTLLQLNDKARNWVNNVAHIRIHATTKERPIEKWIKEKSLLKFPKDFPPYSVSFFTERKATKDAMVQYKLNFYSVPLQFASRKVLIKEISESGIGKIEIYFKDNLITKHILSNEKGRWITDSKHLIPKLDTKSKQKKITVNRKEQKADRILVATRSLDYYNRIIPKHG